MKPSFRAVRPVLLAAVMAATVLAGCASSSNNGSGAATSSGPYVPPPAATHKLGQFTTLTVTSFDGTPIHVDLQLPDGQGPFPALITYTPYSVLGQEASAAQADAGQPFDDQFISYVAKGYVVGVAHVRGTGESGGCLTVGGPEEGKDGVALVETLAKQPWSNGKVALAGTSWDGTTPLETAVLAPPHLAAIVAMSPVTEWYRYYFELGAHRRNGDTFPGSSDTDPAFDAVLGGTPGVRTLTVTPTKLTCVAQFTAEDDAQDNYDSYWHDRDIANRAANIVAPVLYAQGWNDENVATTMIPRLLANLTVGGPWHAWLEQHAHGVPSSKVGFYKAMGEFLDHYLLGVSNNATAMPRVVIEDNNGKFRNETAWPPADATPLRLNLAADNTLVPGAPADGSLSYVDDGTGQVVAQLAGTNDQLFTSSPLTAVHVAGVPRLHLTMAASMPDTQVDIILNAVSGEGTVHFLTRGYIDFAHRDHLDHQDPVVAGTPYSFTFDLHPRDYRLAAGDKLQLIVKSTDDYVVRSPYRSQNTLSFGSDKAWLELPTIDDALRTFNDKAPGV